MSMFEGGWLPEHLQQFHEGTKKWDPISHYSVEWPLKFGDWSVKKTSQGLSGAANSLGINSHLPDMVGQHAAQNEDNFGLSATRAGASAAAIYGGIYGLGGEAGAGGAAEGGAAGGVAGTGEAGTALGAGTGYTMPATTAGGAEVGGGSMLGTGAGYTTPAAGGLDGSTTGIYSEANGAGGSTAVDTGSYDTSHMMGQLGQMLGNGMSSYGKQGGSRGGGYQPIAAVDYGAGDQKQQQYAQMLARALKQYGE